eukprot:scaffold9664_cov17-Tisochrysis_lutea.AAC.1
MQRKIQFRLANWDPLFPLANTDELHILSSTAPVAHNASVLQGNINMIQAAMKKGVKKFVFVTSLGCGSSKDSISEQVYKVLEPVLLEKNKAEEVLMVRLRGGR